MVFAASGEVSDYDEAKQDGIRAILAQAANVSKAAVVLVIAAGSVTITATIRAPTTSDAVSIASTLSQGIFASTAALEVAFSDGGIEGVAVLEITKAPTLNDESSSSGSVAPWVIALSVLLPALACLALGAFVFMRSKGFVVSPNIPVQEVLRTPTKFLRQQWGAAPKQGPEGAPAAMARAPNDIEDGIPDPVVISYAKTGLKPSAPPSRVLSLSDASGSSHLEELSQRPLPPRAGNVPIQAVMAGEETASEAETYETGSHVA